MQAVILAAGKGSRLAPLTETTPKPLIDVGGRPIIDWTINSLPPTIDEILVIVRHHKDKLEQHLQSTYPGHTLHIIEQGAIDGTYGALVSAQSFLKNTFLVLNGDDLHNPVEIEQLAQTSHGFGVSRQHMSGYHTIETDLEDHVTGMRAPTDTERQNGLLIATGAYTLDTTFFSLEPQQMKNGEYGIPHTLIANTTTYPMKIVAMPSWRPINTHEDLAAARDIHTEIVKPFV